MELELGLPTEEQVVDLFLELDPSLLDELFLAQVTAREQALLYSAVGLHGLLPHLVNSRRIKPAETDSGGEDSLLKATPVVIDRDAALVEK